MRNLHVLIENSIHSQKKEKMYTAKYDINGKVYYFYEVPEIVMHRLKLWSLTKPDWLKIEFF